MKIFHAAQDARGSISKEETPAKESKYGNAIYFLNAIFTRITYAGAILGGAQLLWQTYNYARYGNWISAPAVDYLARFSSAFRKPLPGKEETFLYFIASNVSLGVFFFIIGVTGFMICQVISPKRL